MAYGTWCLNESERVQPAVRNGVGPSCVTLPAGPWRTMLEFLCERFPSVSAATWRQRMLDGLVLDEGAQPVGPERSYQSQRHLYYYRAVPAETPIPFEEVILFQDDHLVVVDKPHFLPVLPSGNYLQETLLVRLKRMLGIDALVPLHRIDRDTAGLVLFSVQRQTRAHYNALFRQHLVTKNYQAIAPWRDTLTLPLTWRSRIVPADHFMLQHEVEGPVNAITHLELLERHGSLARYGLCPVTGKRHQLRVHMTALGLPILNDGLYPTLLPEGSLDYDRPLQLLAKSIAFVDPVSGQRRQFESQRSLTLPSTRAGH